MIMRSRERKKKEVHRLVFFVEAKTSSSSTLLYILLIIIIILFSSSPHLVCTGPCDRLAFSHHHHQLSTHLIITTVLSSVGTAYTLTLTQSASCLACSSLKQTTYTRERN